MPDYSRKILARAETRKDAGTYTLSCGHQIAVTDDDWSSSRIFKRSHDCHECERNDQHTRGTSI